MAEAESSNFVYAKVVGCETWYDKCGNISEMAQQEVIVTTDHLYEVIYGLPYQIKAILMTFNVIHLLQFFANVIFHTAVDTACSAIALQ